MGELIKEWNHNGEKFQIGDVLEFKKYPGKHTILEFDNKSHPDKLMIVKMTNDKGKPTHFNEVVFDLYFKKKADIVEQITIEGGK